MLVLGRLPSERLLCPRGVVRAGENQAYQLAGTPSSMELPSGVPKSGSRKESTASFRQHDSSPVLEQAGRNKICDSVFPNVESSSLVPGAQSGDKSSSHCGPRQWTGRLLVERESEAHRMESERRGRQEALLNPRETPCGLIRTQEQCQTSNLLLMGA